ncbi:Fe-S cluster assembly protein SufD [Flavobacteriales bacterium]|nr:Fe-S cluster assembly protein SufD [Flavobacteriales bacterium]
MTTVLVKNKVEEFATKIAANNLPVWKEVAQIRESGIEALKQLEFPTTRNEYWKYSRVSKITKHTYKFNTDSVNDLDLSSARIENLDTYEIVMINGFLNTELSTFPSTDVLEIKTFEDCTTEELISYFSQNLDAITNPFSALNTAYFTDGMLIVAKGICDKPVHLINYSTGDTVISQPRNIIVTKKHAELSLIKSSINKKTVNFFYNSVNEFFLEENSKLNYYVIQDYEKGMNVMSTNVANQARDSRFSAYNYTIKGDWIRNNTNVFVNGENCETNLFGAYQPTENEHIDNHTIVDHLKANCESNEHYKGTVADKATGVFNGKVFVRKDSQKINAFQSNNNILLSDDATMNSKPELEIYADDVKCSHGSTSGQLDEEAVFYLQSRGLSKKSATALLIGAFLGEVVEKIEIPELKEKVLGLYGME